GHAECPRRAHELGAKNVSGIHFVSFFFFEDVGFESPALPEDFGEESDDSFAPGPTVDLESEDFESLGFDSTPPPLPDSLAFAAESDFSDDSLPLAAGAALRSFFPSLP